MAAIYFVFTSKPFTVQKHRKKEVVFVLTTSGGIMDHEEARRKHLGGKILGFFF